MTHLIIFLIWIAVCLYLLMAVLGLAFTLAGNLLLFIIIAGAGILVIRASKIAPEETLKHDRRIM